jgi:hypothetical protein
MPFGKEIGDIIFTWLKKMFAEPLSNSIYLGIGACILTFFANTHTPHDKLFNGIKSYFTK